MQDLVIRRVAWVDTNTGGIIVSHHTWPGIHDFATYPVVTWNADLADSILASLGHIRAQEWSQLGRYWRCVVS